MKRRSWLLFALAGIAGGLAICEGGGPTPSEGTLTVSRLKVEIVLVMLEQKGQSTHVKAVRDQLRKSDFDFWVRVDAAAWRYWMDTIAGR